MAGQSYQKPNWPSCAFAGHLQGYTDMGFFRACSNENARELWTGTINDLYHTRNMEKLAEQIPTLKRAMEEADRIYAERRSRLPLDDRELPDLGDRTGAVSLEKCQKCPYRLTA